MQKRSLCSIPPILTTHGIGEKRVLLANDETETAVTQIAVTHLKKGEQVAEHSHPTMEEYFYFLKGEVRFTSGEGTCLCCAGDFVQVSAGVVHSLEVLEDAEVMTIGCAIVPLAGI
jgi:quercetin dioxygenase-like cupin family protein